MAEENSPLAVEVISSIQLYPDTIQRSLITTPLSIIDNTVSYFARCAAVWFYEPPAFTESTLSVPLLKQSLSKTLDSYRPWCGRLSYAEVKPNGTHTDRYRRVRITYNAPTDLGVTFVTATSPKTLSDFIPSISARRSSVKSWDPSQIACGELLPPTPMALSSKNCPPDAPNVIIQITSFACGSVSIGIAITHGLSDAQSMCTFAKDWANISRALHSASSLPIISPVFNPGLLDSAAAGDIDAENPDISLVKEARSLPGHRFDWYKKVPGQPGRTPDDLDPAAVLSPSNPIPWGDWDMKAPCSGRVFHFTRAEIQDIYNQANSDPISKISKHDALIAHIWLRINLARQLPENTLTYLDLTLGFRSRLLLPQNFLGSPITLVAVPFTTSPEPPSLATLASRIRSYLNLFTPSAIGAFLHDAAFEVSPQRLWRAFLGRKHVLQTSWIQSGFQDVKFVELSSLRYVQPDMGVGSDGLLLVMEGLGEEPNVHWTSNGADVLVYLNTSSMERLLIDEKLWGETSTLNVRGNVAQTVA